MDEKKAEVPLAQIKLNPNPRDDVLFSEVVRSYLKPILIFSLASFMPVSIEISGMESPVTKSGKSRTVGRDTEIRTHIALRLKHEYTHPSADMFSIQKG